MSGIGRVFGKALAGAAFALIVAVPLVAAAAHRMPTDVVYNFTGGADGWLPASGLIQDAAGNFYGTTVGGGNSNCSNGCGVVFKLSPLGVATTRYAFRGGKDGAFPMDTLIADAAGNLYGTTYSGGRQNLGVVFKLTPGGVETALHSFAFEKDGAGPEAGLIMDATGNFYGTTTYGGPSNLGTVFKLAPDGTLSVLHAFTGGRDGSHAHGGLILDKDGNLYGDTTSGGLGKSGTIFKIAPNGEFSVLYTFIGPADGGPTGSLVMDRQGVLYGAMASGGARPCRCGVVFKLAPDGTETVLHDFSNHPSDGSSPRAGLIMDKQGNLFGTTYFGGRFKRGTVFQISPDGTYTILRSFAGTHDSPSDGANPHASLILYMNKLYGTTNDGGTGSGCAGGCGTVFEVKRAK